MALRKNKLALLFSILISVSLVVLVITLGARASDDDYYSEDPYPPDDDDFYFEEDLLEKLCAERNWIPKVNCFCKWEKGFTEDGRIRYYPVCQQVPYTHHPTVSPTNVPIRTPTSSPTWGPTWAPSGTPTSTPTDSPTIGETCSRDGNLLELVELYRNFTTVVIQYAQLVDTRYYRACGWRNDKGGRCTRLVHERLPATPVLPFGD